jgi:AraC-like DNA-binding protein
MGRLCFKRTKGMHVKRKHKVVVGTAALFAAAGGGVAVAAAQSDSRSEDSKAIIDDAAEELGISPSKLSDALKKALGNRVEAAVAAGRLTSEEANALKERIASDEFPLLGGLRHHGSGHAGRLDAAADYLGLTETELRTDLESGKSLARVARDRGKSVDGLVNALVAAGKERIDAAVSAGRLTQAQADEMLDGLQSRMTELVNATRQGRSHFRPDAGFRNFDRPAA